MTPYIKRIPQLIIIILHTILLLVKVVNQQAINIKVDKLGKRQAVIASKLR